MNCIAGLAPEDLETIACPLCQHGRSDPLYRAAHFAPYAVQTCAGCGFHFLSPRPREAAMQSLYASPNYFGGEGEGYQDYAAQELALRNTFRRLLSTLARQGRTGGHLLEVGCGFGYLLDETKPHFERRWGTDYSPSAVTQAARRADQVFQGGVDALPEDARFDCVMATHVIEHVYQPQHFVRSLLRHLRPGGHLVIAAPDTGSFWRHLMRTRWPSFKLPEHILYFDARSLTRLLQDCGVADLRRVPYPHAFPLPLVGAKLGLRLPQDWNRHSLWLPATTVALAGIKAHD